MGKSGRELSQRSQPVLLLFAAGGFTDPVGHQTHETLGQLRHFLYEIRKQRGRKSQGAAVGLGAPAHGKLLHPRKREYAGDIARLQVKDDGLAGKLAPALKPPLKNHKHGIGWIALACIGISGLEMKLLRLVDEPGDLIVW